MKEGNGENLFSHLHSSQREQQAKDQDFSHIWLQR